MLRTIANAFSIPDIRRKILFVLAILALYRLGAYIPAPGVDPEALDAAGSTFSQGDILGFAPPLVVTRDDVDRIVDIARQAVDAVAAENRA